MLFIVFVVMDTIMTVIMLIISLLLIDINYNIQFKSTRVNLTAPVTYLAMLSEPKKNSRIWMRIRIRVKI